jgi:hypothetical protein
MLECSELFVVFDEGPNGLRARMQGIAGPAFLPAHQCSSCTVSSTKFSTIAM